jgi:uncharacterized protein YlxP (DUF503 family)
MENKQSYLDDMKNNLNNVKTLYELLKNRFELSKSEMVVKTAWERNEIKIILIKTKTEMEVLAKVIKEKEKYLHNYIMQYEKDLQEMKLNFDSLYKKANEKKLSNSVLKQVIDNINNESLNTDEEYKVAVYRKIKKSLN